MCTICRLIPAQIRHNHHTDALKCLTATWAHLCNNMNACLSRQQNAMGQESVNASSAYLLCSIYVEPEIYTCCACLSILQAMHKLRNIPKHGHQLYGSQQDTMYNGSSSVIEDSNLISTVNLTRGAVSLHTDKWHSVWHITYILCKQGRQGCHVHNQYCTVCSTD